ncbi:MAG TPA: Holliday junction resolvase-like protein [Candidatus Absconditabacterales bacterium]|nr:Holliday junction resolvase-like protein [Candidatus Absconditabacterales bacterium]HPK27754.1 Holliday junction resolvase-like protein [Candidatus Absconditabacterales bacterium]
MKENLPIIVIGIIIGLIIGYLLSRIYFGIKIRGQRKNAVERSKNVLIGQVNEKIAPILPGFPYNYKDLVFIGKGIDYLVFDGLSNGSLREIVFLEIKSGSSGLNRNETMIKKCIENGKIAYDILRIKN